MAVTENSARDVAASCFAAVARRRDSEAVGTPPAVAEAA